MIYTYMTCKAMRLAYEVHAGQFDACGMPYILHPLHIAEQMDTEEETIAALLHDAIEDSGLSINDLCCAGFPAKAVHAIAFLTHRRYVPYEDYIRNLKSNSIARKVKLADLAHNMDETRYEAIVINVGESMAIERRRKKYEMAKKILLED